ncbi:cilia- and flagella-associated protein 100 [Cyclopterus lumpus]|uniref:cilia- and flagella-associated protein 100 n=1 Tax=Cyclopterus lumpus TaxID=8103 RepID=UPI0014868FF6|nr:cilia- and flagella-associated protein 100 [Cyclopterus lumpus]
MYLCAASSDAKQNAERCKMPDVTSEMLSPHPKGPAVSSGSSVVPGSDSAAKLPQPDKKRKETRQSPFKVPDSHSISLPSKNERVDRKEETRQFLALPIDKKTTRIARMTTELGEQDEKIKERKNLKQIKSGTVLPKQTSIGHELMKAMRKQESVAKDRKHDLTSLERQRSVLELSLMEKRAEFSRLDKANKRKEKEVDRLENTLEREELQLEKLLRENEKKSVEAKIFFERKTKSKQKKEAEIKKLTAEIGAVTSERIKLQEVMIDYNKYKDLLFELSPPEWQEAQKAKALKVQSDGDPEDKQVKGTEESANNNDLESKVSDPAGELPSIRETRLGDTLSTTTKLNSDDSEYEDEPELFFTDPQQILDLMTDLTEKSLFLIQNTTTVEETAKELRKSLETTKARIKNETEQQTLQISDMRQRIAVEKTRSDKLKQMVQLHVSLNTEDQDAMWDALGEKVGEVYRHCVDGQITNLNTLEKLAHIENCMALLLQGLDNLPEEKLTMMKMIMDSEQRSRQRDEKLREQIEKQRERMKRYSERSRADSRKILGRKLMPRSKPVTQRARVRKVDNTPTEDEKYSYLFTSEDAE